MLKRYDGDVENDLCLTFAVEHDDFGARETVELRDGGAAVAVTSENRIEYIHLMADYRLNRELSEQTRAFVGGVHAVVPAGWLRLFSTRELQRLIRGDDAPVDVADMRRHTRYAGGYHDLAPTIRDLWSVLGECGAEDRALFVKFATGCSKPPLLGFAHLQPPLTIQCVSGQAVRAAPPTAAAAPPRRRAAHCRAAAPSAGDAIGPRALRRRPHRDHAAAHRIHVLQPAQVTKLQE